MLLAHKPSPTRDGPKVTGDDWDAQALRKRGSRCVQAEPLPAEVPSVSLVGCAFVGASA